MPEAVRFRAPLHATPTSGGGTYVELPDDAVEALGVLGRTSVVAAIPPDREESLARSIPVRRLATPEGLALLVVWLGSAANTYVSGQTITFSGGAQS